MKETICDLFLHQARRNENKNAIGRVLHKEIHFINFTEYRESIEYISLALANLSIKSQDKVAILSHTSEKWHFYDMAIMSLGAITIPIYPSYTSEEIVYILNHSDATTLIVQDDIQLEKFLSVQNENKMITLIISLESVNSELVNKLNSNIKFLSYEECRQVGLAEKEQNPDQFELNIQNISPDSIATIVYTSGTTGQPKGAVIKHSALFQVLDNVKKFVHSSIGADDRFLTFLPLSHVLGRLESFFSILFSCETVYATDMNNLIAEIPVVRPTILMCVPRVLEKVFEKSKKTLDENPIKKNIFKWAQSIAEDYFTKIDNDKTPATSIILQYQLAKKIVFQKIYDVFGGRLRYIVSGGAPLAVEIIKFMRNANLTVLEGYGLTETVAPCCLNPLSRQIPGTVGRPMGDVEVSFAEDGEILIRSRALFSEYYKDPEATEKVLTKNGWFATGDIGIFTTDGYLKITDRKKDIIITSGGKNVAPQKIENMLKTQSYITQCIIVGDKRKYLTALIGIDKDSFLAQFEKIGLSYDCEIRDLASNDIVQDLIQNGIDNINSELASFETIKKFKILPVELTGENYLTPSLKIKKKLILDDFSELIESMYLK